MARARADAADPPRGFKVPPPGDFCHGIDNIFICVVCDLHIGGELIDGPCPSCVHTKRERAAFRREELKRAQRGLPL